MGFVHSSEVLDPIFAFTKKLKPLKSDKRVFSEHAQQWLFRRLEGEPLTIKEAKALPIDRKSALGELLSQYIMFLTMNSHLTFPRELVQNTNNKVIGTELLLYMHEHRWPFPQLLQP